MKTHYAATKIIASSPENVKYSLGGIKERAGVGFKAGGGVGGALGAGGSKALGVFGPDPGSLQFTSHTAVGYHLEKNRTG